MGSRTAAARQADLADRFVTASRALLGITIRSIEAAHVPVTVPQYRVLVLLAAEGDLTVGEIAAEAGVNQSNASRLCDRLQKLGLVVRRRAAEDGRVVRVSLTPAGKSVFDAVTKVRRREVGRVLDRLSTQEAAAAATAMEAFNRAAHERADRSWRFAST